MRTDFEQLRVAVLPGSGLVARYPGLVCLVAEPEKGPDDAAVPVLLEICRRVEPAGRQQLGRVLARRLAGWLGNEDREITFGTISTTGAGLAVFLSGAVSVGTDDTVLISGAQAAAWVDRLIPLPSESLWLVVDDSGLAGSHPVSELHDLRLGAVPGGGVVLTPTQVESGVVEPRRVSGAGASLVAVPVETAPDVPLDAGAAARAPKLPAAPPDAPSRPLRSDRILGTPPSEPPRPPLPVPTNGDQTETGKRSVDAAAVTEGHLCSRNHLNDPRSLFCVICGVRMNERTGVLTTGPRPPLGLLVFDDGAVYTVDGEYLLGREPEVDERVRGGELRAIMVDDTSGTISRAHAEIRLRGWDVLISDTGSANGTFVMEPGQGAWSALPPTEQRRLIPGARIGLGQRSFVFESPSGSR